MNFHKNVSILVVAGLAQLSISAAGADSLMAVQLDCGQIAKLLEYAENDFVLIRVYPPKQVEDVTRYGSSLSFQWADSCGITVSVQSSEFSCEVNYIQVPDAMNRASQVAQALRSCDAIKPVDANDSSDSRGDHYYHFSYASDRSINFNVVVGDDSASPQLANFSFWVSKLKSQ